ncbi:hypothetical protein KP509_23G075300 [Ceratopteris richardii]|nr:hypothetical protein KP509_23G075300 [Ceratopteris richardii]KAH7302494.1 hypothetical protein KP509_23G075300 [Ceratopteris richardii]
MFQDPEELSSTMQWSMLSMDAALILTYLERLCSDGKFYSVLNALNFMDEKGLYISTHILSCMLQMCMNKIDCAAGRKVHHLLIRLGCDTDFKLASQLVYMYLLCGSLSEALQAFGKFPTTSVSLWGAMILAHARFGNAWQVIKLYHQMWESNVIPDAHILVVVLKASSKLPSLDQGRLIHAHVIHSGLGSNLFIVSALISMYSHSSNNEDAKRVFDTAPTKTVAVWNTLITGHAENGLIKEAFTLYHQMHQYGVEGDRITYISILRLCTNISDVEQGRAVQQEVIERGLDLDLSIVARLIDMYGSSGYLLDAITVFEKSPKKDISIWNAMMATYSYHGHITDALLMIKDLKEAGMEANMNTAMSILKGIGEVDDLNQSRLVHSIVVEVGFDRELKIMNTFVTMYAKSGSFGDACRVFNSIESPDIVTWNAIIGAHVMHEQSAVALQLFHHLQTEGQEPNVLTVCASLNACSKVRAINEGLLIHNTIVKKALEVDIMIMNNLIDMYIKCGNIIDAFKVFNSLPQRDVVTWTIFISGLIQHCQYENSLQLFQQMQEECVLPNHITIVSILKACQNLNALDEGQRLHRYIVLLGLDFETLIINSLVDMYSKCGNFDDGSHVFHTAPSRDVVTWTSMIEACVQHGYSSKALVLFAKMQCESVKPDRAAFLSIFRACSTTAALCIGKRIHKESFKSGFSSDNTIVNSLIDMYMKCGSIFDAQQVFSEAPSKDIVTWTSMIAGYARHHNYDLALEYFENMQRTGITPNHVTFIALLSACAHLGLVKEGLCHLQLMFSLGLPQRLEHLTCTAEMLARKGYLDAAEDVFETSPFPIDAAGWQCLLSHCRSNLDMARRCFDYLTHMDCRNAAAFILMAKIYVNAGLANSAWEVEKLRYYANAWKKAGKAYIEVSEQVYEFVGGDILTPEINAKIQELSVKMKSEGHTPIVDLVLQPGTDEDKENVLCGHCEKQAIAFGLLSTPAGASIRVSKNLRMCADCHSASSAISKIEKREIIITDELCVHVFKDGECSCRIDSG